MRSLIVYSSQTGNTRKLAETLYACWPGVKEMVPVDGAPPPDGYDCIAVGFWLQGGQPDAKSAAYLRSIEATPLFLFASHGAAPGSAHAEHAMAMARSLVPKARVLGTFDCQGEVAPSLLEKIGLKNPRPPWVQDADSAVGHPDQADLADLRRVVDELSMP